MRILIISQFFPPDITAAAFRVGEMGRLLAERQHDLTILTSYPHKAQAADKTNRDAELFAYPGNVRRVHTFPIGQGGATRYLRHYLSFVAGAIWQGLKLGLGGWRPEVIWVSSPPLTVGIVVRFLGLFFWKPYVLEVRDIWPDSAVAAGQLPSNGLAYRVAKWFEISLYRHARCIVCVAQPMRMRIEAQTTTPVLVAYNGVLENSLSDMEVPIAGNEGNLKTILFAGNIGLVQQIDLLVEGFAELIDKGVLEGWRLRILGTGAQSERIRSLMMTHDPGMKRMELLPPVSRNKAYQVTLEADVLYLSLCDDSVLKLTIPSKLFDYLLAGKPIVGGIAGEGRDILNMTGANVTFKPGNKDDLQRALLEVADHYENLQAQAYRNRDLVLSQYTRQKAVDVLEKALVQDSSVWSKEGLY